MPCYFPFKKKGEDIPLPCGKCPYCLQRRANNWIFRCQQELKVSDSAHFVTLTYEQPPHTLGTGMMTLYKPDLQNFFKRLRKIPREYSSKPIRYYAVGEYGSENRRPHYHIILFNSDPDSVNEAWRGEYQPSNKVKRRKLSNYYKYSTKVFKLERIPDNRTKLSLDVPILLGITHFGEVNESTIAYTAKYINKGTVIPQFKDDDRCPEFQLFSKGLGKNFLDDPNVLKYYLLNPSNNYVTVNGFKKALPRYFKDKIFTDDDKLIHAKIAQYEAVNTYNKQYNDYLNSGVTCTFEEWRYEKKKAALAAFRLNDKNRNKF